MIALRIYPQGWLDILVRVILFYCLSVGGFYLVYSLIWKSHEEKRDMLMHIVALIVALAEVLYVRNAFYVCQILVLLYGASIAYDNYKAKKGIFQQFYFIGLALAVVGYAVNFAEMFLREFYPAFIYYTYAITVTTFIIFAIGMHRTTKHG
jgi:hypothetical protein